MKRALFLDRDGVINKLLIGDYIKTWEAFEFCDDVLTELPGIVTKFDYVFVVTNQQCIGKGIISVRQLDHIHQQMTHHLKQAKIFITEIFYCPHLSSEKCDCRKPKPGMLLQAKAKYPDIDLSRSYFVGDSRSDIIAAQDAGVIPIARLLDHKPEDFDNLGTFDMIMNFKELHAVIA